MTARLVLSLWCAGFGVAVGIACDDDDRKLPNAADISLPHFEDVSGRVNAIHQKLDFNDYERQPLLPRKLSQNGPGVSWLDLNGDGSDDLVLGAGRGKRMQVWTNDGSGKLISVSGMVLSTPTRGDQTTIIGWRSGQGTGAVVLGLSGYELGTNLPASVGVFALASTGIQPVGALAASANVGPLAAADLDGDGDLDVFVGGQAEPGQYPVAARSVILRQTAGHFTEDIENTRRLAGVGLVNGAIWSDLDGDGACDLVLACEWGPVRVFRNKSGVLVEATVELGLANRLGWWNGIAAGDFDGDGRMDLVASNWGRNTKYQEFIQDGLRLYHGDLDGSGARQVIEAYWDRELKKEVPWTGYRSMGRAVPSILTRFQTYAQYASSGLSEIFGDALRLTQVLRANTLESTVFLNKGGHFDAHPLPPMAQLAPAFAVVVADFDGDGKEDIFLSQNSFSANPETGRYDGGRSLWLRGDGVGSFTSVPASASGLSVFGEQRGAAVADFDNDGRPDLVVAQHAAALKLFRNRGARSGVRIRLAGPNGNSNGIGAQLRMKFGQRYGAVRELHAGSGYWSQDSTTVVLAQPAEPSLLWVRWPGGAVTESPIPGGALEVSVDSQGHLRLIR